MLTRYLKERQEEVLHRFCTSNLENGVIPTGFQKCLSEYLIVGVPEVKLTRLVYVNIHSKMHRF